MITGLFGLFVYSYTFERKSKKKGKLGAYAMKREAAGAHHPTPWVFEPAKLPDNRAD